MYEAENIRLAQNLSEGLDASDGLGTTYQMDIGDSFAGDLSAGDSDWIAIDLSAGEAVLISLDGAGATPGLDTVLSLYDSDGQKVQENDDVDFVGNDFSSQVLFVAPETSTYYIAAAAFNSGTTGSYELTVSAAPNAPEVGTLDEIAAYMTTGFWEDRGFSPYSYGPGPVTVDITRLRPQDQQLARWAFEAWEMVAGLSFTEVQGGATLDFFDDGPGATGGPTAVNIEQAWSDDFGTTIGSDTLATYIHEIGHALGLGHPGDYPANNANPTAAFLDDAHFANDSWQVSSLSYFAQTENTAVYASYANPVTAMIADIIAIQSLYGAPAGRATAGDTVWGKGTTLTNYLGVLFDALFETPDPTVYDDEPFALTIFDEGGRDTLDLSPDTQAQRVDLTPEGISDVLGLIGNLVIARGTVIESYIAGAGGDHVLGNAANNTIQGNSGADSLYGAEGDDTLEGGNNTDRIEGGVGNDRIRGDGGSDMLIGDDGEDTLDGGQGADTLKGRNQGDSLNGQDGDDLIEGNKGADTADGGAGNDTLNGGPGADTLRGGADEDVIEGKDAGDSLFGDSGDDTLSGNNGADTLDGGSGDDALDGGPGLDTLLGDDGADDLSGRKGTDVLDGGAGKDSLAGGGGADTMHGGGGDDTLTGGLGADEMHGGGGNDSLTGSEGDDRLDGGAGDDTLQGGGGADAFVFGAGQDSIKGFSEGVDSLLFDASLWGGAILSGAEIASAYGDFAGKTATFTFDGGETLTVNNVASLELLAQDIGLA